MARCGCANEICACHIIAGDGIIVTGNGSAENEFVIESANAGLNLIVQDTDTVDLTLTGTGTPTQPYILSADSTLDFTSPDSLEWRSLVVPASATAVGTAAAPLLVPFTVDNGGAGINFTGGRMVVTKAGVYHISAALTYTQTTASSAWIIQQLIQRRAGAAIATRETVAQPNATGDFDMGSLVGDFAAQPNDTFEVLAWSSAASLTSVSASRSHLVGHRLAGPGLDGQPGADGAPGPPGPTGSANVPIGTILAWSTTTPPEHYLICNGQQIPRATYADLYNVIKTDYNLPSDTDSTMFRVPNLASRFLAGSGPNTPGGLVNFPFRAGALS